MAATGAPPCPPQVASGSGLLADVGVGDTLALARYYLWGTGRCAGCADGSGGVAGLLGGEAWRWPSGGPGIWLAALVARPAAAHACNPTVVFTVHFVAGTPQRSWPI